MDYSLSQKKNQIQIQLNIVLQEIDQFVAKVIENRQQAFNNGICLPDDKQYISEQMTILKTKVSELYLELQKFETN
jgi:hypothetical protein